MIVSYVIERMRETDLLEVVQIEESSGLNRWGYEAYRRELLKNKNAIMLVARDQTIGGSERPILGFFAGWVVADELHVNNIATRKDSRRIGVGQGLLEAAIEDGSQRGVRFVLLEVRASNNAAQSLYSKLHFRFVGRRRDYYRSPIEDALMMRLELN
ncbi:MAG: ribosomal protein S18-alanine N-acetyltransferase [Blastocatellia bacterium]